MKDIKYFEKTQQEGKVKQCFFFDPDGKYNIWTTKNFYLLLFWALTIGMNLGFPGNGLEIGNWLSLHRNHLKVDILIQVSNLLVFTGSKSIPVVIVPIVNVESIIYVTFITHSKWWFHTIYVWNSLSQNHNIIINNIKSNTTSVSQIKAGSVVNLDFFCTGQKASQLYTINTYYRKVSNPKL